MLFILTLVLPASTVYADSAAFVYQLRLTDQDGREIYNPRTLDSGDTLHVEIELTRTDSREPFYDAYGMEFRLESRGLDYNYDGASFRSGSSVTRQVFDSGDSVGFAFYDMELKGEQVSSPVLAGSWSYQVTDPGIINITVPVALLYLTGSSDAVVPVGNARLFLDPDGGEIIGEDVSGEYPSGTAVILPDAKFGDHVFQGWSMEPALYQPGDEFTVTGVVTLKAQWGGLERNRQVTFDPNGGSFTEDDPSGMYADGEQVSVPDAQREGYNLKGWKLGEELYHTGDIYTVNNSVVFFADWHPVAAHGDGTDGGGSGPAFILICIGLLLVLLLLLILGRYVRYSLLDGGVRLSYRDRKKAGYVQVYLNLEGKEYFLVQSGLVEAGKILSHIDGTSVLDGLKKGFYKGHLHITYTDGSDPRDIKVCIHALKKELNKDRES